MQAEALVTTTLFVVSATTVVFGSTTELLMQRLGLLAQPPSAARGTGGGGGGGRQRDSGVSNFEMMGHRGGGGGGGGGGERGERGGAGGVYTPPRLTKHQVPAQSDNRNCQSQHLYHRQVEHDGNSHSDASSSTERHHLHDLWTTVDAGILKPMFGGAASGAGAWAAAGGSEDEETVCAAQSFQEEKEAKADETDALVGEHGSVESRSDEI